MFTFRPQRIAHGDSPGAHRVESRTRAGVWHVANPHTGHCTCEAGQAGRCCWHLDYVRSGRPGRGRACILEGLCSTASSPLRRRSAVSSIDTVT
jgi:hypothetical protein